MKALLLLLASLPLPAAAEWKAGAAKVSITPEEPVWLAGFASRKHPSEGVRAPIFVKALALQDETGKIAVLVTADVVDVKRDVWDVVAERCAKQFGVARDRLLLNESHTHSAPIINRAEISIYYPLDAAQHAAVRRYTEAFIDRAVEAVGKAIAGLSPATLAFRQSLAGIAVNRRRVTLRHLPGPVDHDVPVIAVRDSSGKLSAIVAGYACHATTLSDYLVSGDWPGYAQEYIEQAHPGAVALFVQGAGADSNPLPRGTAELAQLHGRSLAAAVEHALGGKMKPLEGPLRTAFDRVDLPFRTPPTREELNQAVRTQTGYAKRHAERLLSVMDRAGRLIDRYPYPIQIWRFGGLRLIALSGELVVDYSLRLKALYGWEDTWIAGYSNDTFAYIPSLRVLREGGYEGGNAMIGEDFAGPFAAAVEEIVVEKTTDLLCTVEPTACGRLDTAGTRR